MQHKQRYGSPRIAKTLNACSISCSENRVARRMQKLNLQAIARRKFRVTTDSNHLHPVYENILNRDFAANGINEKWVGDITYVATKSGWLYLAVVIDLYSRAVIGWSMGDRINQHLVCDALMMALFKRKFPKGVIMHTNRGSQYCSKKYKRIIANNELTGSMSRRGNCWDNAVAESFFHTLKVELSDNSYQSREHAKQVIFRYIEGYYNRQRLHSALDYRTPYEVECA
jgi:putative transposase